MATGRPSILTVDSSLATDSISNYSSPPTHHQHTHSLTASITNYPIHWGRRYHKYREGSYVFPNDSAESERLDKQHAIFNHYFDGRLYMSPLDPEIVEKVLDLGTGTGLWPIELADTDLLPRAEITGIDLSSIQPHEVPENVFFEIQDCSDADWCRDADSIDFIHSRFMAGSLESYKNVIRTAREYLKPGTGWLECHEIHPTPMCDDGTIPDDWKFKEWEATLDFASRERLQPPRPIRVAHKLRAWMEQAGYVDLHEHVWKVPMGPWPRDKKLKMVGREIGKNWLEGLPAFSYKLLGPEGMGWSREEVELEMVEVRKSLERELGGQADRGQGTTGVHAYLRYWVVYGRRPCKKEEVSLRRM